MKRLLAALAAAILLAVQPAHAQSILRDAETEKLLNDMSAPLITAAGLRPRDVRIVLVNDDSINAFVAGGQMVFVHTGTLQAATSANEVQGVIAHELGHIAGGHVPLAGGAMKEATGITLLSLLIGVAAIAAGGGEAGAGVMAAGQQAAMGRYLAFSRAQEASTDAAGAKYLSAAGITGKGYLSFFKKMQQLEYRYGITRKVEFLLDHPVSSERIANLTETMEKDPAWAHAPNADLESRFKRVQAKLDGYLLPPAQALQKYPESDQSLRAHYARAYAYHRSGYPDKADAEGAALLRAQPDDPYFQEIVGQILLEAGKPKAALAPLKAATDGSRSDPLIATTYGHALIATEDPSHYDEARRILRIAVARDDQNPFAWQQLGTIYELTGDDARAALATAERASMTGDPRTAVARARYAMAGIPKNTADWIRAQDIAMTAQDLVDKDKKKKK
ncbi:M48 family metalloprotease [Sphingomonas corticis]|jgi:predicted Zn-dependent protease|uniref:M48 family metalloprotease n=1 Tax=Sphingomonas corticis TaxID=2722791 RepID=A0ABX1CPD2_9SPHN|nr:M48 family metalloprotease [Sphingomonas corticis]NJR78818.1 M48 family metalloprotease [Sphingomonas corticis]